MAGIRKDDKTMAREIVRDGVSAAVGMCSAMLVNRIVTSFIPVDAGNVNKIAYKIGTYGLYTVTCMIVKNAVDKDISDCLAVVDVFKKAFKESQRQHDIREAREEREETDDVDGTDAEPGQLSSE